MTQPLKRVAYNIYYILYLFESRDFHMGDIIDADDRFDWKGKLG